MFLLNDLWNRVGLISKLSKDFENSSAPLGKTAVMKNLFILQEVFKVPCGYKFSLYTYGPYCSDVLSDLDYTEAIEGVKINTVGTGYNIKSSTKTDVYIHKAECYLEKYKEEIEKAYELFGNMSARDLELHSTIIYIYKNYIIHSWDISISEITNDVRELKPYFSENEIHNAFERLNNIGVFERLNKR